MIMKEGILAKTYSQTAIHLCPKQDENACAGSPSTTTLWVGFLFPPCLKPQVCTNEFPFTRRNSSLNPKTQNLRERKWAQLLKAPLTSILNCVPLDRGPSANRKGRHGANN